MVLLSVVVALALASEGVAVDGDENEPTDEFLAGALALLSEADGDLASSSSAPGEGDECAWLASATTDETKLFEEMLLGFNL